MPQAARIGSTTDHGGQLVGTGVLTVTIEGAAAAVVTQNNSLTAHKCGITPPPPHQTLSSVMVGSATVSIGGSPAARVGEHAQCGATIVTGAANVFIGG